MLDALALCGTDLRPGGFIAELIAEEPAGRLPVLFTSPVFTFTRIRKSYSKCIYPKEIKEKYLKIRKEKEVENAAVALSNWQLQNHSAQTDRDVLSS